MSKEMKAEVGDVVQLVSGGPVMTIRFIKETAENGIYRDALCQWFNGKKLEVGWFGLDCLCRADAVA